MKVRARTPLQRHVIARIVKPTSFEPSYAAHRRFAISMCRAMFSSITIVSSTTKPTLSVSAISEGVEAVIEQIHCGERPTMVTGSVRLE